MASLNPRQIEAFRMVMLRGSVTAAAQILNVSQPAVSRLIRDLEVRTGLTLFERLGNHLVPTPEASLFLAEVERYAVGLAALSTYARELADLKRGGLRIVAMPALAMGYLPRLVAQFIEGRALSHVYLHGMPSHLVIEAVATGQADIGFAAAPPERPGMSIESMDVCAVAVVPHRHRFAKRRFIGIAELKGEPIVALSEPTIFAGPVSPELDHLLRSATVVSPLTGILCQFVAAGAGIAIVDPFAVAGLDNPDLVSIPIKPAIPIRIAIVTSTNRRPSTLSQEFIAATKAASPFPLQRLGTKRRQCR
jgi:DNA-binding transcriptional LysR family regulator